MKEERCFKVVLKNVHFINLEELKRDIDIDIDNIGHTVTNI
jgi:hypothetical protein